ncbi:unnamed protein product [Mucor hiemalis]
MAAQVTSIFQASVSLPDENIVCQQHSNQVCEKCDVDWREHNDLAASIKHLKELPPPNKPVPSVKAEVNRLKVEGNRVYKEEKYQEAVGFYTKAVELSWNRPLWEPLAFQHVRDELAPILSNRSASHVALGNYIEALADAEIVTKLKKEWSKGWFRKGKALFGLGRNREAIQAYKVGIRYDSTSEDLLAALKEAEIANQ